MVERGKRYKVLEHGEGFFKAGEVVIPITTGIVPFCVREKDYDKNKPSSFDYEPSKIYAMLDFELEEINNA